MDTWQERRRRMVDQQIVARGIRHAALIDAMRTVPRDAFVPAAQCDRAFEDGPLPIGAGQTISQPYVVALMIEAAGVQPHDRVLEVGAGSGYVAAVLARIARRVFAVERHAALVEATRERLVRLGYANVALRQGDGATGWPEEAPFDVIIVSAGGATIPEPLCRELALGGRLVMPVGGPDEQRLLRIVRTGQGGYEESDLGPVRFVPLVTAE